MSIIGTSGYRRGCSTANTTIRLPCITAGTGSIGMDSGVSIPLNGSAIATIDTIAGRSLNLTAVSAIAPLATRINACRAGRP